MVRGHVHRGPRGRSELSVPPSSVPCLSSISATWHRPGVAGSPSAASTTSAARCATSRSCVVDLETTGGSPGRLDDHRDRRGQGPRRRGARRVPDPGQPRAGRSRRSSPCSPASPTRWWPTRRRIEQVLPAVPRVRPRRVLVAHNAPFDVGFLQAASPSSRAGRGRPFEVLDTAELARRVRHPRRGAQLQAGLAGRALRRRHHAQPPRARRRPRHRRRAARADRAARQPRACTPSRSCTTFSARVTTAQRRKRHLAERAPRTPRASTSSATTAAGCSTSARRPTCAPGCAPTSPPPRPAPGWARWSGWRPRCRASSAPPPLEAEVRELRLIAEHKPRYNRRSRFPERVHWIKLTVEPFPRLSVVRAGPRRRRRLPRAVRLQAHRRARRSPRSTRRSRCGSAAAGCPSGPSLSRARSPRWASACPRATAPRRSTRTTPPSSADRGSSLVVPTRRRGRLAGAAGWPRWPRRSGSRTRPSWRDRLAAFLRGAARTQRLRALTRLPRAGRAPAGGPRAGPCTSIRHGRLAAAGVIPPGAHAAPVRRRAAGRGRDGESPARARPRRRPPRRPRSCCAGWSPTGCAWCTSTASGAARSAARPSTCGSTTRSASPARAWCRSTTARSLRPVHQPVR